MELQSASALWWLLPLAAIIIVLYLLRMRRQDVRVPATFLWPRITADVRANAPIQKLRITLLLILQLLALTLLVCALANPLRRERGLRGRTTVLVLDASASMGATDVVPSRFDEARRRIRAVVGALGSGDRCALVEAGPTTRVIFPLSNDRPRMLSALGGLTPSDAPGDMGEALRLAAALVGQQAGGRIVVFSDGAFPAVRDFSPGRADLLFDRVGQTSRNLAVTALDAAEAPDGGAQVFAGLHNYASQPLKTTASFYVDGTLADARSLTVPAGQTLGQTLRVPPTAQRAAVRLSTPGDILKADDAATLFLHGAGTIRALLVSSGDLFLERALALEPTIRLDRAPAVPATERAGSPGESAYDLVIFDGVTPQPVKASAVWSFGGVGDAGLPVTDAGPSARPRILAWKRDDPILRYADWQSVLIEKAHRVQAKPGGRVLVQGSDGPLVVASEQSGRRALYVGWSLLDSDFPLRLGFPIFVDNALQWLTPTGQGTGGGLSVRAGQPFTLAAPRPGAALTLQSPDGTKTPLDTASGVATIRSVDRTGVYTVTGSQFRREVAVNLLDERESDVMPRATLDLSGRAVAARGSLLTLSETWRPLVLLGLLVLAGEWWLFVRRS